MTTWNKVALQYKKMLKLGLAVTAVASIEISFWDNIASIAKVTGCSMQPLLNPDYHKGSYDWILQWKKVSPCDFKRGDVVTFIMPYDHTITAIKRVVAVESDLVRKRTNPDTIISVPTGYVWVEGDNGKLSRDSNNFGPIPFNLITSKVTHVIWPPSRWQSLNRTELEVNDRLITK